MKTHLASTLAALLVGASLSLAQNRVIPSDPGADSGSTGSDGAGAAMENRSAGAPDARRADASASLPRDQRRFFDKLALLNAQELQLSRVAAQRATLPELRSFAEDMVKEHGQLEEQLTRLASLKGASLRSMDARKIREIEKDWSEKKSREFDKDYLAKAIDAHEDTIDVLEKGARVEDPEVAAFAKKVLPQVRGHLERARSMEKAVD